MCFPDVRLVKSGIGLYPIITESTGVLSVGEVAPGAQLGSSDGAADFSV
ncbi:hypothetical protein MIDIC_160003 [Alphaproteobacteria bacterium]